MATIICSDEPPKRSDTVSTVSHHHEVMALGAMILDFLSVELLYWEAIFNNLILICLPLLEVLIPQEVAF